jgi:hypothetical protein
MDRRDSPPEAPWEETASAVFVAWEWLRVAYNLVLAAVVLGVHACLLGFKPLREERYWEGLAYSAVMANVCFCAGPWAEGWLAVLGAERGKARSVLFCLGTLLACLAAGVELLSPGKGF